MSKGIGTIMVYCEHVTKNHVHCNKCTKISIGLHEKPIDVLSTSDWEVIDGKTYCPEDANEYE